MGAGEGDFHRTRLTHSIEAGQIGEGILGMLQRKYSKDVLAEWLPSNDLVVASCYAHDLGHPPFGHGGERALNGRMLENGGFEGNGQTLRILMRLEKLRPNHQGTNPTRRLVLAILNYPIPYSAFSAEHRRTKPPKCYFDSEQAIVDWALSAPFSAREREMLISSLDEKAKPKHRTLDCSLMECADDIAYGVHDLEDIVARHLVGEKDLLGELDRLMDGDDIRTWAAMNGASLDDFKKALFGGGGSASRKAFIGLLVNAFVTSVEIREEAEFEHPLLRNRVVCSDPAEQLLDRLKKLTLTLVIRKAEVQQLERRGQRIIEELFDELVSDPGDLIPKETWLSMNEGDDLRRRVCDYVAGMTDRYAERIYERLFIPGIGSSRDEL